MRHLCSLEGTLDKVPVTVIGGGFVGLAIADELAQKQKGVVVLEKHTNLGEEQSGHSSGVIHASIYYATGSRKAVHCFNGNIMMYEFCPRYEVPHARIGKYVVAMNELEDRKLEPLHRQATENGVPGIEYLTGKEVRKDGADGKRKGESNVDVYSALYFPSTGIVETGAFLTTLAKLAERKGAHLLRDRKVVEIEPGNGSFHVTVQTREGRETFETEFLINAAGLYADEIAKMVNPENDYQILPGRGEYYTYNQQSRPGLEVKANIYPIPVWREVGGISYLAPGVHLTPTFEYTRDGVSIISRTINVGPAFNPIQRKDDYGEKVGDTPGYGVDKFYDSIHPIVPTIRKEELQRGHTGIWADLKDTKDFVFTRDKKYDNCIHVLGTGSPALTSCLSMAKEVNAEYQGQKYCL